MEQFKILSLNYFEVTKQPELFTRPYQLTMDASVPELVNRRMYGSGGLITPDVISDISGDILNPSAVGTVSAIDAKWMQQPRYGFILKVVSSNDYGVVYNYIHGYTNYDGISSNDGINAYADYDMVHYVTSVIETTPIPCVDSYGQTYEAEQLYRIYDVINDNSSEGIGLIRPTDIIDRIASNNLASTVESNFHDYNGMLPDGYDDRQDFGMYSNYDVNGYPINIPKHDVTHMSNRISKFTEYAMISDGQNNNPNLYLTNVLNKGIKDTIANRWEHNVGSQKTEYGFETNYNSNYLEETELRKNAFLSYLSSTIIQDVAPRGVFTFNDLLKVDVQGANDFSMGYVIPDDVTHVLKQAPHIGGGEFWDGTGPTTLTAWSILQTVLSIVSRGFGVMVIELTPNMIISGPDYNVGIINSWSYMNVIEQSKFVMMDMIKERIYHDVYMRHSKNGRIRLSAKIFININGDSKIYLEYGDAYGTWYTLPTVANAHVVPIVGKNENVIAETTNMFSNFISTLTKGK